MDIGFTERTSLSLSGNPIATDCCCAMDRLERKDSILFIYLTGSVSSSVVPYVTVGDLFRLVGRSVGVVGASGMDKCLVAIKRSKYTDTLELVCRLVGCNLSIFYN